jgi:hypothetical protein
MNACEHEFAHFEQKYENLYTFAELLPFSIAMTHLFEWVAFTGGSGYIRST